MSEPVLPQPVPHKPDAAPSTPIPAPVIMPHPPVTRSAYTGPASGVINWSGQLEKNGVVSIEGDRCSVGSLNGRLPGVPVMLEIETSEFALAEVPAPSNGWNRMALRSKNRRHTVISIKWTVLP